MTTSSQARLPLGGLLALALASFITVLTEALPAGLLPGIAAGFDISEALAGQMVTVYALGSLLAAVPVTLATRGMRRRPLLLASVAGFVVANGVTAVSGDVTLTLVARFAAGVAAGVLWALLAGYAARMAPEALRGRAIAIAMAGTPLALSLGVPAGTFLGGIIGWRASFALMSLGAALLMVWIRLGVPDFPGEPAGRRVPASRVLALPGVAGVLAVMMLYVLAHNLLYTYIAPLLALAGLGTRVDLVLAVFGLAAILGIWATGLVVDRHLRRAMQLSLWGFVLSAILLAAGSDAAVVVAAIGLWGLAFGGAATLFQTALARAAGPAADVAQSMLVTGWNLAIAGGGLVGGLLLDLRGPDVLGPVALVLLLPAAAILAGARRHGFPGAMR
ncbi:MAG: MFS transporter [Tistrella sp.]|uniref:MFS transporter n=1 Tax=Tistrella mobilis TaxID=171437 RepID=A0A3B9IPA7_9PROT|nr:MFS transporter [Tistrella sp.]MAD39076.1 MFS transporter [Tistrella sp.]MBA74693.1 MFS transporter [Tistrella sp.]HAE49566.1 MFS transporter [Tistrella mobilis]